MGADPRRDTAQGPSDQIMPKPPLVDYSDSDTGDDAPPPAKLQKISPTPASDLPPLPTRFHELYAVNPRGSNKDDPELHGGRKRAIPHERGNWPTHVFVEWHLSRAEFEGLDSVHRKAAEAARAADAAFKLESHLISDLGAELPLHLSLSRPNVLRTEQRDGFLETLKDRCRKARIKPFPVEFSGFEWVSNHEKTRWFLVMAAAAPYRESELPRLLQMTNTTCAAFEQPPLYTESGDPTKGFHVSLAWSLAQPSADVTERVGAALRAGSDRIVLGEGNETLRMQVDSVKVKIGSTVHVIELGAGDVPGETAVEGERRKRKHA